MMNPNDKSSTDMEEQLAETELQDALRMGDLPHVLELARNQRHKYREQRDAALVELESLRSTIKRSHLAAQVTLQNFQRNARKKVERVNLLSKEADLPQVVALFLSAFHITEKIAIDHYNATVGTVMKDHGLEVMVQDNPRLVLEGLAALKLISGIWDTALTYITFAYGYAHDPVVVAEEILRDCRTSGEPKMTSLRRLPLKWIKTNLPDPPGKYSTLFEGLKQREAEMRSGLTREEFLEKATVTRCRLQEYQGWYDKLDEISRSKLSVLYRRPSGGSEQH
jgi:hypothetical protein